MKKPFNRALILATMLLFILIPGPGCAAWAVEVSSPDYWISQQAGPDAVIVDERGIVAINEAIARALPWEVYKLTNYPMSIRGSDVRGMVEAYRVPGKARWNQNGSCSQAYFEGLVADTNLDAIPASVAVQYGIAVMRTDIRTFPTNDPSYSEAGRSDFDYFQETTLYPAEPVLVLHQSQDGSWLFVQMYNYRGWARRDHIAITTDRNSWELFANRTGGLVVTAARIGVKPFFQPESQPSINYYMGNFLPLASNQMVVQSLKQIFPDQQFAVVPLRDASGNLDCELAAIPNSADVSPGFLPYTRRNLITQAFKLQGEPYGWGGMKDSWDCSSLVTDVYACFGFRLPRNTDQQEKVPCKGYDLSALDDAAKVDILKTLPTGAGLYTKSHAMIYLGQVNGEAFMFNSSSSNARICTGSVSIEALRTVRVFE